MYKAAGKTAVKWKVLYDIQTKHNSTMTVLQANLKVLGVGLLERFNDLDIMQLYKTWNNLDDIPFYNLPRHPVLFNWAKTLLNNVMAPKGSLEIWGVQ